MLVPVTGLGAAVAAVAMVGVALAVTDTLTAPLLPTLEAATVNGPPAVPPAVNRPVVLIVLDGFGIGGSFNKEDMATAVKWVNELLPKEKPRHLLGIGEPEDLFMGVENGVDLFDCVAPTRNGRGGTLYTTGGKINIRNAEFRDDPKPVETDCECYTCKHYSRGYLCHLYRAHEILGGTLGSIHNLYFIVNLVKKMRLSILDGTFADFKKSFLSRYEK